MGMNSCRFLYLTTSWKSSRIFARIAIAKATSYGEIFNEPNLTLTHVSGISMARQKLQQVQQMQPAKQVQRCH
jgi:hypothetical protein